MKQFFNQRVSGGIFHAALLMAFLAGLDGATSWETVRGDASGVATVGVEMTGNLKVDSTVTTLNIFGYVHNLNLDNATSLTTINFGRPTSAEHGCVLNPLFLFSAAASVAATAVGAVTDTVGYMTGSPTSTASAPVSQPVDDEGSINELIIPPSLRVLQLNRGRIGTLNATKSTSLNYSGNINLVGTINAPAGTIKPENFRGKLNVPVTIKFGQTTGTEADVKIREGTFSDLTLGEGLKDFTIGSDAKITKRDFVFPKSLESLKIHGNIQNALKRVGSGQRDMGDLDLRQNINLTTLEFFGPTRVTNLYLPNSLQNTILSVQIENVLFAAKTQSSSTPSNLTLEDDAVINTLNVPNHLTNLSIRRGAKIENLNLENAPDELVIQGDFADVTWVKIKEDKRDLWVSKGIPVDKLVSDESIAARDAARRTHDATSTAPAPAVTGGGEKEAEKHNYTKEELDALIDEFYRRLGEMEGKGNFGTSVGRGELLK